MEVHGLFTDQDIVEQVLIYVGTLVRAHTRTSCRLALVSLCMVFVLREDVIVSDILEHIE